jgi:type IV secretory pathway VirB10-like protein
MRDRKAQTLLPALLCAAALFTFACNRGEDRAGEVSTERETAPQTAAQPENPAPQSVEVHEVAPPAASEDESAQLDARERELKAREAELDARESRLREFPEAETRPAPAPRRETPRPAPPARRTEERRAEVTPKPVPQPSPKPSAAPAPVPEPAREEPTEVAEKPAEKPAEERTERPLITTVTLPAGTHLDVEFTRALASNTSAPGDTFRVRVAHDVMDEGEVVIPRGSEILGEVTEAVPLRKVGGQAKLALRFTDLVLPDGATVPIDASFVQQGRNETGKDAATIGGAAAGGAVLGRILNKGNRSRGAVIGAIIGAVAGTAIASRNPGEEVVIPEGSVVGLRLDDAVDVRVQARR